MSSHTGLNIQMGSRSDKQTQNLYLYLYYGTIITSLSNMSLHAGMNIQLSQSDKQTQSLCLPLWYNCNKLVANVITHWLKYPNVEKEEERRRVTTLTSLHIRPPPGRGEGGGSTRRAPGPRRPQSCAPSTWCGHCCPVANSLRPSKCSSIDTKGDSTQYV